MIGFKSKPPVGLFKIKGFPSTFIILINNLNQVGASPSIMENPTTIWGDSEIMIQQGLLTVNS